MKRTLVVIRHAKTEQHSDQLDFDRNLVERGRNDAALMGERLKKLGLKPDLILCSPANRTIQTSRIIADALGYDNAAISTSDKLYMGSADVITHTLMALPAEVGTCFLVGHNPGVSQFVYDMQKELFIGEMPTAGLTVLNLTASSWLDLPAAKKQLVLFDHPKK